jgi:hypothetical protein
MSEGLRHDGRSDSGDVPEEPAEIRGHRADGWAGSLVRERARVSGSNWVADVAGDPAGRVEAHGLRARQCREVILDPVKFGGADLLCPLIA